MKFFKLSQDGLMHQLLPLVVIFGVAVIGTTYLLISHANPLPATAASLSSQYPQPCPTPHAVLKSGSKGVCVYDAQNSLLQLGFTPSTTSTYDSQTIAAVKKFQTKYNLTASGNFDANTWNTLGGLVHPAGNGLYRAACTNFTLNGSTTLSSLSSSKTYDIAAFFKNMGNTGWKLNLTTSGAYPHFTGAGLSGAYDTVAGVTSAFPVSSSPYPTASKQTTIAKGGAYEADVKAVKFNKGTYYLTANVSLSPVQNAGQAFGENCVKKIIVN